MQRKLSKPVVYCIFCLLLIQLQVFAQTGGIPTGTDTSCSNGISFYQKVFGGNKDDYGFYLAPTLDSGYVVGGRTLSYGNGGYDGLLMKVNKKGTVSWSKAFGGSGFDYFQAVIRTSDNGFLGIGQTKSYGNTAGDAWLVKTDASGNLQWSKKYGDGNVNGDIGFDVVEISEGGYVFCGTHRYTAGLAEGFVVRTDNSGNVIWSRQYGNGGSDQLWGITEDGGSVVVAGFYQNGSNYDSYVMKLDKLNGNIQWMRGYDGENRSTQFYRIRKNGSGFQVLGLVMDGFNTVNQQNFVWNLQADGTVQNVRKMVIPGTQNLDFGWYPRADGGFITVNGEYTSNSDLYISNVNPDGSLAWSKKFVRPGQQFINNVMPLLEGGYAAVGYNNTPGGSPLDSNEVYVVRFDSLGNAGNCSGINTTDVTVLAASNSTPTPDVVSLGNVTINNPVISAGSVSFIPISNTLCYYCHENINVVVPPDSLCSNGISFYQKVFGGNKDDYGFYLAPTLDSGYVVGGRTLSYGNGGYDGLLMKVNKKGTVSWSKAFGGSGFDYFQAVIRTSDNGFLGIGQTKSYGNTAGDAWLVKTDASGNLQWSKKYGDGNVNGDIGFDVVEISEGGYVFCGTHRYTAGLAEGFVVRTDNSGNVIWSRQYGNGGSDQLWGITEDGGSVVVAGFYQNGSNYDSYVMKLDKLNGNIQWMRGYDGENRSTQFYRIRKNGSGFQVLGLVMDGFNTVNQQNFVWNLQADGTVQNVRKMVIPGTQNLDFGWYPRADGGFITVNGEYTSNSDLYISNVNPDGSLAWSKKFVRPGQQFINNVMPLLEGGYAAVGYNNTPGGSPLDSNEVYVVRFDSLGNAGNCSGINTTDVTVLAASNSTPTPDVVSLGNVTINNPVITVSTSTFVPVTGTLCFYCQPKPLGSSRPSISGDAVMEHQFRVYPNPVVTGTFFLDIEARFDDVATINIIDMNGTVQYVLSPRRLMKGQNIIRMDLPIRLRNYTNYLVSIQFGNYSTSAKIFVLR